MGDHEKTVRAPAVRSVNGNVEVNGRWDVEARGLPDVYLGSVCDEEGSVGLFERHEEGVELLPVVCWLETKLRTNTKNDKGTNAPVDLIPASSRPWSANDRERADRSVRREEMRRLSRPTTKPALWMLPRQNLVDRAEDGQ